MLGEGTEHPGRFEEQQTHPGLSSASPGEELPPLSLQDIPWVCQTPQDPDRLQEVGNRSQGRLKAAQGSMGEPFQGSLPFPRALVHAGFVQLQRNDFIKHLINVISIKMPFKAT